MAGYDKIVSKLVEEWTAKEVEQFVRQSMTFFQLLKQYPYMLEQTQKRKHVHRGPINSHTIVTYRVKPRKQEIEILNIRAARQKPLHK